VLQGVVRSEIKLGHYLAGCSAAVPMNLGESCNISVETSGLAGLRHLIS
jgi:hypothetical protein